MNAFRDDLRALVSKHIAELPVEQIVTLIDGSSSKSAAESAMPMRSRSPT